MADASGGRKDTRQRASSKRAAEEETATFDSVCILKSNQYLITLGNTALTGWMSLS